MRTKLDKSIEYIRGYCLKHFNCEECKLNNSMIEHCSLKDLPCNWQTISEKSEVKKNDRK